MQKHIPLRILSLLLLFQVVVFITVPTFQLRANTESAVSAEQVSYVSKTLNNEAPFIKLDPGIDNIVPGFKIRKKNLLHFSLIKDKFNTQSRNYSQLFFNNNPPLYGLPVRIVLHLFRI